MESNNVQMTESNAQSVNPSKKRTYEEFLKPELIMHRFKSKSDFITYFSESRK